MENVVFTQLTVTEIQQLIKSTVEQVLSNHPTLSKQDSSEEQLLNVKQAAALLHCSVSTIYNKCSEGTLPYSKKGKHLYFSKADLIAWVQTGKRQTIEEIQQEAAFYLKRHTRGNSTSRA